MHIFNAFKFISDCKWKIEDRELKIRIKLNNFNRNLYFVLIGRI